MVYVCHTNKKICNNKKVDLLLNITKICTVVITFQRKIFLGKILFYFVCICMEGEKERERAHIPYRACGGKM